MYAGIPMPGQCRFLQGHVGKNVFETFYDLVPYQDVL